MKEKDTSNIYQFTISGNPTPWNRPGQGRFGRYDTQKSIKKTLGLIFRNGMRGNPPITAGVKIVIVFHMPTPKKASKLAGKWHTRRPDLDNCIKLILDSMNGIVFNDDSQVCAIIAMKGYSEIPRTDITISEEFDEGSRSISVPEDVDARA